MRDTGSDRTSASIRHNGGAYFIARGPFGLGVYDAQTGLRVSTRVIEGLIEHQPNSVVRTMKRIGITSYVDLLPRGSDSFDRDDITVHEPPAPGTESHVRTEEDAATEDLLAGMSVPVQDEAHYAHEEAEMAV
jgi:hypothetical protein